MRHLPPASHPHWFSSNNVREDHILQPQPQHTCGTCSRAHIKIMQSTESPLLRVGISIIFHRMRKGYLLFGYRLFGIFYLVYLVIWLFFVWLVSCSFAYFWLDFFFNQILWQVLFKRNKLFCSLNSFRLKNIRTRTDFWTSSRLLGRSEVCKRSMETRWRDVYVSSFSSVQFHESNFQKQNSSEAIS